MMVAYLTLAMQLREELENLERVVASAVESMSGAQQHPDHAHIYVNSAALELHSFYVGLERIFLAVAEQVDESVPSSASWHFDLVNQMTYDLRGLRPPVLRSATRDQLHEYRAFRHVVRNVYTYQLEPARVERLITTLPIAFESVKADTIQFIEFLDSAADAKLKDE
jgi:hypothetical protein